MNFIKLIQLFTIIDYMSKDQRPECCVKEKEREVLINLDNILLARQSGNNTRILFHGTEEEMLVKISFSEFCEKVKQNEEYMNF